MTDLKKLVTRAHWTNEMSDFGIVNGNKITFSNSGSDHGIPHFHYGSIKIKIPEIIPSSNAELKTCVFKNYQNRITDKDLSDIRIWLAKKSTKNNKFTNLELLQIQKDIWYN